MLYHDDHTNIVMSDFVSTMKFGECGGGDFEEVGVERDGDDDDGDGDDGDYGLVKIILAG